jgi:hypothetical protein
LIADGVRAPVQPRGVLAKFEDLCAAEGRRQATEIGPTDATVDGSRVASTRAWPVDAQRYHTRMRVSAADDAE